MKEKIYIRVHFVSQENIKYLLVTLSEKMVTVSEKMIHKSFFSQRSAGTLKKFRVAPLMVLPYLMEPI